MGGVRLKKSDIPFLVIFLRFAKFFLWGTSWDVYDNQFCFLSGHISLENAESDEIKHIFIGLQSIQSLQDSSIYIC